MPLRRAPPVRLVLARPRERRWPFAAGRRPSSARPPPRDAPLPTGSPATSRDDRDLGNGLRRRGHGGGHHGVRHRELECEALTVETRSTRPRRARSRRSSTSPPVTDSPARDRRSCVAIAADAVAKPEIGGDAPIGITADEWRMLQLTQAHLEAEAAAEAAEGASRSEAAVEAPVPTAAPRPRHNTAARASVCTAATPTQLISPLARRQLSLASISEDDESRSRRCPRCPRGWRSTARSRLAHCRPAAAAARPASTSARCAPSSRRIRRPSALRAPSPTFEDYERIVVTFVAWTRHTVYSAQEKLACARGDRLRLLAALAAFRARTQPSPLTLMAAAHAVDKDLATISAALAEWRAAAARGAAGGCAPICSAASLRCDAAWLRPRRRAA